MKTQKRNNNELSRSALRRQREKQHRIHSILNAAENLFAKKGYNQTSIEEIADLSEVSVGTVYIHFKNKEDLLVKLIHDIGDLVSEVLWEEFEGSDHSLLAFNNLGHIFLTNFCLVHPEKNIIFFRESVGQSIKVEEHRKQVIIKITTDIQERLKIVQQSSGGEPIPDSSYELLAVFVVGMFAQMSIHYFIWQDKPDDLKDISYKTNAFLLGGIGSLLRSDSLY
jgi:AcrR family transcriptional regulator